MKKWMAFILAVVLSLGASTASAKTIEATGSSDVGTVTVTVKEGTTSTPTVRYVTVSWDSLAFTYQKGTTTRTWKPGEHEYDSTQANDGWVDNNADIIVTNHSNIGLTVAITFGGTDTSKTVNGVTATISNHTFDLASGDGRTFANADAKTATVTVSDAPSTNVVGTFNVGDIKIQISDKTN